MTPDGMTRLLGSRLNLASRPFLNQRPIRRVAGLLWMVAAVLMLINGLILWRYQAGSAERSEELSSLRRQTAAELVLLAAQRDELLSFDLAEQNAQVEFLNSTIAERRFPWSHLFDDLVEAMPREVRLTSLTPTTQDRRGGRGQSSRARSDGSWITLKIQGESSDDDAQWVFVERLFEHPAFADPSLLSENRKQPNLVSFDLVARYRTGPADSARRGGAGQEPEGVGSEPEDVGQEPEGAGQEAEETTAATEVAHQAAQQPVSANELEEVEPAR